jgi:TolB-like protein
MLCLAPHEPIDRDHLSKLLWPGRFQAQARASLRQCLLELGKVLDRHGDNILLVARSRIGLNRSAVATDLCELENALAAGAYAEASERLMSIGAKPLLDRMTFGDEFEAWLRTHRRQAEGRIESAILAALTALEESEDTAGYARLLRAWQVRNPGAQSDLALDRLDGKTRIAVLPFQSFDSADDQDYFAQGIVDELITALGQAPQLLVAGRRSSFQFNNADAPPPDIARALRVSHLVEGSVQRQGDVVRINVRLIDGATGFENWAQGYSGTIQDIFALQENVARAVTRELGAVFDLPSLRGMTKSKAAYELYLQGRALTFRAIGDGVLAKAIEWLEEALAIDPGFAACWTALAEAHVNTAVYTPCLDRLAQSERMAECAQKAIALDPSQGHARAMLGIHQWTLNDPVGALDLAHEAYRLEANNPDVAIRLGSFLLYIGRTREALPYIEAGIDQDPVFGRNFAMLSVAHLNLGNIDAAIAAGQRMVDLGMPSMWLAVATAASGDHAAAVEQYRRTRLLMNTVIFPPAGTEPLPPDAMDAYWLVAAKGVCSGQEEDRATYCRLLDGLNATIPDGGDTSIVLPAIWMGYAGMVFKTLGTQITPANMYTLMSLWADIEPIRQIRLHPDFMCFASRIGLVAAWEKYGWPDLLPEPPARASPS